MVLPASNGLVERFLKSLKTALKTSLSSGMSLSHHLSSFLLTYHSFPHATTGVAPVSPLLAQDSIRLASPKSRELCRRLPMIRRPNFEEFHVGQLVMAQILRSGDDWVPATVVERTYT